MFIIFINSTKVKYVNYFPFKPVLFCCNFSGLSLLLFALQLFVCCKDIYIYRRTFAVSIVQGSQELWERSRDTAAATAAVIATLRDSIVMCAVRCGVLYHCFEIFANRCYS